MAHLQTRRPFGRIVAAAFFAIALVFGFGGILTPVLSADAADDPVTAENDPVVATTTCEGGVATTTFTNVAGEGSIGYSVRTSPNGVQRAPVDTLGTVMNGESITTTVAEWTYWWASPTPAPDTVSAQGRIICPEPDPDPTWGGDTSRIGGTDRYHTASLWAGLWGVPGNTCVNIAQGRDDHVIDSITGGMMGATGMSASSVGSSCVNTVNLHVRDEGIPSTIRAMLEHLQPPAITVLGGEGAVSAQLLDRLRGYTDGDVVRIGGTDRYQTAAAIARTAVAGGLDTSTVFLANGEGNDLANALSAAALKQHPVLLVRGDSLPRATAEALAEFNPTKIVVVGNTDSVSETVEQAAGATARVDGVNHEEVSVNLMNTYLSQAGGVFIARDDVFADGLAVSTLSGPVVTVRGDVVSPQLIQSLNQLDTRQVVIAGGYQAVSYAYETSLREASRLE